MRDLREALDRRRAAGTLDYGNVTTALFEAVPEVRGPYEEQAESWGLPSEPHAVFGLVVVPELLRRLEAREDSEGVKRMFAFLERMATAEDPAVREIVEMTVCPSFHETRALLDGARKQMGEATLGISRALDAEVRRGSPG